MAYVKTNWSSTTPINATNLNKIEDGIEANEIAINSSNKTKIINITRSSTANAGNVSYTGVGFKPKKITFYCAGTGTDMYSIGASDNDKHCSLMYFTGGVSRFMDNMCIMYTNQGSYSQKGVISSYDNDGFTITWTKIGTTPAATMNIICVCES